MNDRTSLRPRKPLTTGSFLVVLVAGAALFAPTMSAHIAVMNAVNIDATPTDYALSDDGDAVVVEIRVHNPTRSAFTASYGELYGKFDGTTVTTLSVEVEDTTVPAGGTETVTARIAIADGYREEAAEAVESDRLRVTGLLEGRIQDVEVEVEVAEGGDD